MIARAESKQTTYLASLFVLLSWSAQANQSTVWYYNEKLTTPTDSRAVLKPYQHSQFRPQNLAKPATSKQWAWQQHNLPHDQARTDQSYLAPKSQQSKALPFWPDLKPK